jgi:group I intron endonuclease
MPCAYVIENLVNGKLYVGFTSGEFIARWKRHQLTAAHGYETYFIYALRKYGAICFRPMAVFACSSAEEAKLTEIFLIALFNTQNAKRGYNLTAGGDGTLNPTPETRRKISEAGKGRVPSVEARRKISESKLGNKVWLGRKHSEETKCKMSLASKGNRRSLGKKFNLTPEQREARRVRMLGNTFGKGKTLSEQQRQKIREAAIRNSANTRQRMMGNKYRLGIPHSEEERAKMREGHARRKALASYVLSTVGVTRKETVCI